MSQNVAQAVLETALALQDHFNHIHQHHMRETPLCNPALRVEAVDFQPYRDQVLGVVITPWFMNLILAPLAGNDFPDGMIGDKRSVDFAAGPVLFNIGEVPEFGRLDTCSLFSPMSNFATHQMAADTARSIMDKLLAAPAPPLPVAPAPPQVVSRRALLRGLLGRSS